MAKPLTLQKTMSSFDSKVFALLPLCLCSKSSPCILPWYYGFVHKSLTAPNTL